MIGYFSNKNPTYKKIIRIKYNDDTTFTCVVAQWDNIHKFTTNFFNETEYNEHLTIIEKKEFEDEYDKIARKLLK
jgi:hypothetical protein